VESLRSWAAALGTRRRFTVSEPSAAGSAGDSSVRGLVQAAYFQWLPILAVALGIALRTADWLRNRSLWLDEYAIADNLTRRGYRRLLLPLDENQGAPVGWLWAERTAIDAFGVNERVLRLVPFLASVVGVVVFARLAKRLVGRAAAPAATVLFATAPALIYFASETKQYSSDVTCVLGVTAMTASLLHRQPGFRAALLWAAGCGLLAWCSHPAVSVSGAAAVVLAFRWARQPRAVIAVLTGCVLLVAILLADYWVSLRALSRNAVLRDYWQVVGGYPPTRPGLAAMELWLRADTIRILHNPFQLAHPTLVVLLVVLGFVVLAYRRPSETLLVTGPLVLAVALAVTHQYPLAQRLALYLLPYLVLLLTGGLLVADWPLPARFRPLQVGAAAVVALGLLGTAAPGGLRGISKFWRADEVTAGREVIEFVSNHRAATDLVLAEAWSSSTFQFYGPRRQVTADRIFSFTGAAKQCGPDPLTRFRPHRIWAVLTHHPSNEPADRTQIYLSYFAVHGALLQQYRGAGDAGAYLFDFSRPPPSPPPPLPSWIPNGCLSLGPMPSPR
jgi:Dolichyl-phosphate-mannose-protein mannosyltransferase